MPENPLQQHAIYFHHELKLFHIGTHNEHTIANGDVGLAQSIGKAKWSAKKYQEGEKAQAARGFDNGFYLSLIFTNYEGWDCRIFGQKMTLEQAEIRKAELVERFEGNGYKCVSGRHTKNLNRADGPGNRSWGKKLSVNMPTERLNRLLDRMFETLPDMDERLVNRVKGQARLACWRENSGIEWAADLFYFIMDKIRAENLVTA
jgi:hypothetical protein